MRIIQFVCVSIVAFILQPTISKPDVVVCYYPNYSAGVLPPEDINVSICTHVTYAFIGINEDGSLRANRQDPNLLRRMRSLKKINENLKLLISIGGWSDAKNFSKVAASEVKINKFVEHSLQYIREYDLDGIDIDWEYPARNGGTPSDKNNFITMCQKLKSHFKEDGYLLTAALWSNPADDSFDVPQLSKILDLMNIMLYDFHMSSERKTGENAPLYGSQSDSPYQREYCNCNVSLHNWLNKGSNPRKMTFGLAFYGRSYRLEDPEKHFVGAPTIGPGNVGATYRQICQLNWTEVWNDEQKVPYKYYGDQWVGFDNPQSIALKVEYAKSHKLAGVMIWTIAQDDIHGLCGQPEALINAVKDAW